MLTGVTSSFEILPREVALILLICLGTVFLEQARSAPGHRLLDGPGCPPDVVDVVASLLGDGSAVLRSNGERLALYMRGDDWEAWFSVEPTGFRRLA